MIAETKKLQKILFVPAVFLSTVFTLNLILSIGSNFYTKILWGVFALVFIGFQVLCLLTWKNRKLLKKPYLFFKVSYLFLTAVSLLSTFSFGVQDISRTAIYEYGATSDIETLDQKISYLTQILDDTEDKRRIAALTAQIKSVTYRVSERSLDITHEIDNIKKARKKIDFDAISSQIRELKAQKEVKIKSLNSLISGFGLISAATGIKKETLLNTILFLFSAVLELVVYTSAAGYFIRSAKKTEKKGAEQLTFFG